MTRPVIPVLLASLAIFGATLLVPAPAAAGRPRSSRSIQITLHGTHDYGIVVSGRIEGAHSTVTLSAGRPISSAAYSVPGTITSTRVHASFGRLGSVALHLTHYRTQKVRLTKSCRPPGSPAVSEVEVGTFVGEIRFHGEHDFTSGSARRVRGAVGESTAILIATGPDPHLKLFCLGGPGLQSGKADTPGPATLEARSSDGAANFLALALLPTTSTTSALTSSGSAPLHHGPTTFVAGEAERRGRMQISRSVTASAPAADFTFDPLFTTATVIPPAPFHGRAIFRRGADGTTSWSGSLTASLPGAPNVALAGPQFEATLGDETDTSGESCAQFPGNHPC